MRPDDVWQSVMEVTEPHEQQMRSFMRKKGIQGTLDQDELLSDLRVRLVRHLRGRVSSGETIETTDLLTGGLVWVAFQNQLKDSFRQRRRAINHLPLDLSATNSIDSDLDLESTISSAIQSLSESDARLVRHVFFEQHSQADFCQQLGISPGTISRRLQRILQSLSHSPELRSLIEV